MQHCGWPACRINAASVPAPPATVAARETSKDISHPRSGTDVDTVRGWGRESAAGSKKLLGRKRPQRSFAHRVSTVRCTAVEDFNSVQALHAGVLVRARVQPPFLIQLEELDAFVSRPRTGRRLGGPLARLCAEFFGEVPAAELLRQRAGLHQPEDVSQRGLGVDGDQLEQKLVRAAGEVDLLQSAARVVGLRSKGSHDQLGPGRRIRCCIVIAFSQRVRDWGPAAHHGLN